jgi:site-specific DNA recombinase
MTLAVILGRVSTEDQAEDGTGLPGQIEACLRYVVQRGYMLGTNVGYASEGIEYVPGVFQEDYTGKVIYRPAINHLLDVIEAKGIKVVVIHRTSRLGRRGSVQEAIESLLKERGARAEYVTAQFDTSTATGRAMRRISGVFDELDYENIIEQLKEGKVQRVKMGSFVATFAPFGYRKVKERGPNGKPVTRLEIVEEEAKTVLMVFEWYVYGDDDGKPLTIREIARRLTAMSVPTRCDEVPGMRRVYPPGVWGHQTVGRMLQSEVYIGRWYYGTHKMIPKKDSDKMKRVKTNKDEWLYVEMPAIIGEDLFQAARERAQLNLNALNVIPSISTYLEACCAVIHVNLLAQGNRIAEGSISIINVSRHVPLRLKRALCLRLARRQLMPSYGRGSKKLQTILRRLGRQSCSASKKPMTKTPASII